jgi:hypothetical protein
MAAKKVSKAAKRLAAKPKSVRSTGRTINLPDGYKVIERAPNWDVDVDPVIQGVRGEASELTFGRGTKNEYDAECFVVTDPKLGERAVWRSSGLAQLFEETEQGDEVYIEFRGYGEPKNADDSPPKLFRCAVKEGKSSKNPF